jgi:hypothetical protein
MDVVSRNDDDGIEVMKREHCKQSQGPMFLTENASRLQLLFLEPVKEIAHLSTLVSGSHFPSSHCIFPHF